MATGSMTGRRRELSPADRAARRAAGKAKAAEAVERLDAAVAEIVEHDSAFREYLRLSGRMHTYSWGNRLLIALQRPDAGMVGGFNRWRSLGRPVRKGAKGIQILAPMVIHEKVDATLAGYSTNAGKVGEDGSLDRVVGFRVAYVFAVEDTDGPPIGLPRPVPESDDSFESAQLAQRLQATAANLGFPVDVRCSDPALGTGSDGKPAGWADLERREIVVNGDLPAAARCKTLAHEIAHLVADHRANDDDRR
ncbi:MAG: ArdC-like ssDNA-binding domain-containing protein, partial [Mycobacteriales bacterium]